MVLMQEPERPCSKCTLPKPMSAYFVDTRGHRWRQCNDCYNKHRRDYRASLPRRPRPLKQPPVEVRIRGEAQRRCQSPGCGSHGVSFFGSNDERQRKQPQFRYCKGCLFRVNCSSYERHVDKKRQRAREYYAANREKVKQQRRDRYAADPEKARAYARSLRLQHRLFRIVELSRIRAPFVTTPALPNESLVARGFRNQKDYERWRREDEISFLNDEYELYYRSSLPGGCETVGPMGPVRYYSQVATGRYTSPAIVWAPILMMGAR